MEIGGVHNPYTAIFDLSMGLTEKKRRDSLSSAHV
jgi:hypothetical protein